MSENQTLNEWLESLKKRKAGTIDFSFPSDKVRDEYIATIERRSDAEIFDLLRRFLIPSGPLGSDKAEGHATRGPWEGITWVLDLLPDNPRSSLATLDAYLDAHFPFMPDGRICGMFDTMEIIRTKYIEHPRSPDDAIRLLLDESPRTLEHLVERLYAEMGYTTALTPSQKDGGYDVLATKNEAGHRAKFTSSANDGRVMSGSR
jgi:restriction system protein